MNQGNGHPPAPKPLASLPGFQPPGQPPAQQAPGGYPPPYAPQPPAAAQQAFQAPPPGTFGGISQVNPSQGGTPFPDGTHRFTVEAIRFFSGHKGQFYICEMTANESSNPLVQIGETYSWVCKINSQYKQSSLADIKAHIAACRGMDVNDPAAMASINDQMVGHICGAANPLKGARGEVTVRTSPQKNDPTKDFSKHFWKALSPNSQPLAQVTAQPPAPGAAPVAPAVAFPPNGWIIHPQNPAYFWKQGTQIALTEEQLRAAISQGTA